MRQPSPSSSPFPFPKRFLASRFSSRIIKEMKQPTSSSPSFISSADCDDAPHLKNDEASLKAIASNHVMVNRFRYMCGLQQPLMRSRSLDKIARQHALDMASKRTLSPYNTMSTDDLQKILHANNNNLVGQNVYCGNSIQSIQESLLTNIRQNKNILCPKYTEFGVGTAVDDEGQLYMCQLFRQ